MGKMVRKQIYIKPEQDAEIKRQAEALGISEAELIRRRIERPVQRAISYPANPAAWEEELRFIEERAAQLPGLNKPRTWTREDAYEERLGRFSR